MSTTEFVLKEKNTINKFLNRQRRILSDLTIQRGKAVSEEIIPPIIMKADEKTLKLAFEPVASEVSYVIDRQTGEIFLHPQQIAAEIDNLLKQRNIDQPTTVITLAVLNHLALSIRGKEIGITTTDQDEIDIFGQTTYWMMAVGELEVE